MLLYHVGVVVAVAVVVAAVAVVVDEKSTFCEDAAAMAGCE